MDRDWDLKRKHIFVLSSSGKPIFCRHGDEQEHVTVFGLLQAVVSIVEDYGDNIRCIKAGHRRIVYFIRKSLYFVCVSSTGEPEAILTKQLEFLYTQILLVLTSKVHSVLEMNSSKDLRDLLGPETTQLMHSACQHDITSPCIAFEAVKGFSMESDLRTHITQLLKSCTENSGAALGMLLFKDSLVSYVTSPGTDLPLSTADTLLLSNFVGCSSSFKAHDQNWVPICLPQFNSTAFLQAYICNLKISFGDEVICLFLVLISASSDPSLFKDLHDGRTTMEMQLSLPSTADRLTRCLRSQTTNITNHLTNTCLHFFYKTRPKLSQLPAQCLSTAFFFPTTSQDSQERIWCAYQRLGVCLRKGSSCCEQVFFDDENGVDDDTSYKSNNPMSQQPASDHSLTYAVLSSGHVVVGLATSDSELYATFPGTVSPLDACGHANYLSRAIKADITNMFLVD